MEPLKIVSQVTESSNEPYGIFQLPRDSLVAMIPHLVRHLQATSHVVHTYAAHCVERLLMVRTSQGTPA